MPFPLLYVITWLIFSLAFILLFIPEHKLGEYLKKEIDFVCPCGYPVIPLTWMEEKFYHAIRKTERRKESFMLVMLLVLPAVGTLLVVDLARGQFHKRSCLPYQVGRAGRKGTELI